MYIYNRLSLKLISIKCNLYYIVCGGTSYIILVEITLQESAGEEAVYT